MGRTTPTRLRDRGRVTIPKDIREEFGLEHGDWIVLKIHPLEEVDTS
ncbi:AbrB/MazE/SpoVT family DNA-binding domain-containing protein [Natrinema marinum]